MQRDAKTDYGATVQLNSTFCCTAEAVSWKYTGDHLWLELLIQCPMYSHTGICLIKNNKKKQQKKNEETKCIAPCLEWCHLFSVSGPWN